MGERIRFALERFGSPRHRSHVAQLFSLGCYAHHAHFQIIFSRAFSQSSDLCLFRCLALAATNRDGIFWPFCRVGSWICSECDCHLVRWHVFANPRRVAQLVGFRLGEFVWLVLALFVVQIFDA